MNKREVMLAAHREFKAAKRRGWHLLDGPDRWTWSRCLRFAWAQARARRDMKLAA